jgi:hypothetical protein
MPSRSFEIHLRGRVPPDALLEFETLHVVEVPSETLLRGVIEDQAALYGILARLQSLGLELIEVRSERQEPG